MKFNEESGKSKIILIILVLIILVVGVIIFLNLNKEKTVETIKQKPYEYFALYSSDGKVGIIDKEGNKIIENKYSQIYIPNQSKDVFFCFKNETEYTVLDKNGKDIFTNFTNVMPINISDTTLEMEKDVLYYEENEKYGLVDYSGKKLTDAIYEEVSSLTNKPGCILVKKDGLYGVLDSEGKTIVDIKYNSIKGDEYSSEDGSYEKEGYIVSEKTKNGIIYGYIDYKGKLLIDPKYESINRVVDYEDDIYLIFMDKGKKGIIKNNKIIVKSKYQAINFYTNSKVFVVNKNGKYGFLDENGKEILKPEYESFSIAGNYISVKKADESRLYDLHGNLVNTNNYVSILETGNPSFFIAQDEKGYYSIISKDVQIDNKYTYISYAFDNFFIFTNEEGKSGVLNVYTGIEVEPEYDNIILLENARALEARKENEVDIYSENFEKTLSMVNGVVESVNENYISIYSYNDLKYIDNKGNLVKNTDVFKDLPLYSYQAEDGKWGFKDKQGNIVVNAKYDIVTELNEYGFAGVYQEGKWGVIDNKGNEIVVPTYELETYYSPSFVGKYLLEELEVVYCTEINENK